MTEGKEEPRTDANLWDWIGDVVSRPVGVPCRLVIDITEQIIDGEPTGKMQVDLVNIYPNVSDEGKKPEIVSSADRLSYVG